MAVTVVIPTYNRINKLLETLRALSQQSFKEFSVIVVDDGSVDGTTEAIRNSVAEFPYPIQIIYQQNAGASAATNNGVRLASDGLVILFDDDIIPSTGCIAAHVAFHSTHTSSILSGSADTDPKNTNSDVERYKLFMEQKWREARPDTNRLLEVGFQNFIITTANMSFQRETFMAIGGFSTELRDGYDVDFGFRALLNKTRLYFDRNVATIHNDKISLRYYAGRQRAYTNSKKEILKKFPELQSQFEVGTPETVSGFKSIAYSLLRKPGVVRFVESAFFAATIPRSVRYRVYGSTIAALSLLP